MKLKYLAALASTGISAADPTQRPASKVEKKEKPAKPVAKPATPASKEAPKK